jgi:anti-anti-sigma factor
VDLTITSETDNAERSVLLLDGALDLESRDELVEAARVAGDEPSSTGIVVDLAGVSFMDSSGIGALIKLAGAAEDAGLYFGLRNLSPRAERVLRMTGLLDTWPIESS